MTQQDPTPQIPNPLEEMSDEQLGLAGRTARFFIDSPLSPLLFIAMMLMGLMGLVLTPRQEDPQISVPMIDIFVQYPGAEAEQVATLAIDPLERIMSEIKGVKHVYSASQRGQGIVTVEFDVGELMRDSLVKVNDKLDSNMDMIPPGVMPPLVKAKGIDDVPVVNLTLWSKDLDGDGAPDVDDGHLRMLAHDVLQSLKEIPGTGSGFVVGGRSEQITVEVFPERLSGYGISLDQVAQTIRTANAEQAAGGVEAGDSHFTVVVGRFLRSVDDIAGLVVGSHMGVPVYVHDVARVTQGPEDATQLVAYSTGPASDPNIEANGVPAVTIAIAKKEGTNGVTVANAVIERVHQLKGRTIPSNVEVSVTRDYGATANDKVNELIFKLFMATGFVFFLVLGAFRAFRPAIVVVLVIPVVLLFTVFAAWILGFTIDRVSLFALIFSIGILVDDAIVVVENIYRRWLEEGRTDKATAVDAVREVGNPTILATFTVIAALLPMGFVRGMMGPYMFPIPALGSVAMLISLFAAFVFTPWLAISRWLRPSMSYLRKAEKREHKGAERMEGFYRRILTPLMESKGKRFVFRVVLWGTFAFACSMFYTKWVAVKMLPLDNKPEFSVVLDMPEGTALPVTANLAHHIANKVREMPEVTAVQVYAGTARPFDFNGMVRHYYLRSDPWQAEIQVQLLHKTKRKRSSHQIAVQARQDLQSVIEGSGARIAVVEMPPGPPVLQSVVAEVHGPSAEVRRQVARDLTEIFAQAESARDVDNYLRDPYEYWRFDVDTEKSVRRGISVDVINRNLSMALGGGSVGDVKQGAGHEPVNIVIQVPLAVRSQVERLGDLPIPSQTGQTLPLRELGRFEKVPESDIIFHKDLRSIEMVVADVGGRLAAPVYAMFQIQDLLKDYTAPDGVPLDTYWLGPPANDDKSAIEWTGEWTVTYETFRDMGGAFMIALVLIYVLVVWEFGNFRIPALIMAPIPLTLLGIIPAHFVMFELGLGGEFTATSMIGWIALAGIIVRNSILLVDFSVHEIQRGIPVAEAVIRSCKTRTRPIMITALALVAGSSVIFTDPIFQGMAISLASGVMVSTILTLVVIPLGCMKAARSLCEVAAAGCPPGTVIAMPEDQGPAPAAASKQAARVGKPSLLMRIWSGFANVLLMIFYALRGILLLILQLFKRSPKPKGGGKPPAAGTPKPTGGGPAGSITGPGGTVGTGSTPVGGAESSSASDADRAAQQAKPVAEAEGTAQAASALAAGQVSKAAGADTPTESQPMDGPKTDSVAAAQSPAAEGSVAAEEAHPVAAAQQPKDAVSVTKAQGKKVQPRKPTRKATAKERAGSQPAADSEPTEDLDESSQKKTPRRGIRLKASNGAGGGDSGMDLL